MKKILTALLLLPAIALGAANDLLMSQRNSLDTGTLSRTVAIPASGQNGLLGFNGSTILPIFYTIGPRLTLSGGSLDAVAQVQTDWNATSGLGVLINKPSTFPPSSHTQAWSTITATPTTLGGYGITDAYPLSGNPSGFLSSITSGQVAGALGFTPYNATNPSGYVSQAGARSAISLTTNGTSGAATYNSSTGALNVPNYANSGGTVASITAGAGLSGGTITTVGTISMPNTGTAGTYNVVTTDAQGRVTAGTTLSINDAPGRSLVNTTTSTGFQVSATRISHICYEGSFSTTSTIGGPSSASVFLETADTNSSTPSDWTTKAQQTYSNTITLAVVLNQVQGNNWSLCRFIPAGKFVRVRVGSITGTASATINATQQEVLY